MPSKMERQSKLHGNELQSVVCDRGEGEEESVGLCKFGLKKRVDLDHTCIGLEQGVFTLTFSKPFLVSCSS